MATDSLISHNYAKALLRVVEKDGLDLDVALEESRALRSLLQQQPKFQVFLEGPQFREEDKERVVSNVLQNQIHPIFFRFVLLLLRRDRIGALLGILDCFDNLVEQEKGIVPGTVITAIPLLPEEQQYVQEKLEAFCQKKFLFRFQVDPDIIGGIKVKYADILIDTSISTYLGDLRMRLHSTRLA